MIQHMKKAALFLVFLHVYLHATAQSSLSPEAILGYTPGARFTPSYKVVNYFRAVAQAKPATVKVEKYGETYEGRELIVAFIGSPENIGRLEAIRMNNLRLAGIIKDNVPADLNAPAIVWLSYNVHGNEPSSTEAAMLTLFALADENNAKAKEWLKNTVVVIDPCQNPDGRDRYVNWYTTTVGKSYNPDPQSREHNEPWPYGRTNHYNFDLNRDWAWQTQKESQERIKNYNRWLPEVHVDLHEQGYNDHYYFAPAVEPYHKVITQWQRDFQVQIGRNNAKYFDENGWLYFTKEVFDLFYPSYGDTYPTYNGAVGMTYEQAGIEAGLGVQTTEGDTLTLAQRAQHHFTTSMATIETSSANAARLIKEFKKFFDDNIAGAGMEYKTYVLTAKDPNKLKEITKLLDANGINYGTTTSSSFRGYNYFSGKDENYVSDGFQLALTALQPKGKMASVLFEPFSSLSDSATYDITAWSIPYAYGVKAYAVKEKLDIAPYKEADAISPVASAYGLLIPYTSFTASKLLADLLQEGVKVRFSLNPFIYQGKSFDRGTLIILRANNTAGWNDVVNAACKKYGIQPVKVESGFMDAGADFGSEAIHFIKKPRIAFLSGKQTYNSSSGEVWSYFDNELGYPATALNAESLDDINLSLYDVLVIPDGSYAAFAERSVSEKLYQFAKNGGRIIAMESGAAKLSRMDWTGFKLREDKTDSSLNSDSAIADRKYAGFQRAEVSNNIPGAIYRMTLDNTHPLAFGYPDFYYTLKQDSRIYDYMKDGWNTGTLNSTAYVSGFVGSNIRPKLKNGMLAGTKNIGDGSIVIFSDDLLFRLFWQSGKQLFANALFFAVQ